MSRLLLILSRLLILPVAVVALAGIGPGKSHDQALAANQPVDFVVENLDGSQFVYVVFHALDRDGFCSPPPGAVSVHPVLGLPVDFVIEAGDGVIIESSGGGTPFGRTANDVPTFSTAVNTASSAPIRSFAPLIDGLNDECQAWIKVSQSIPGPLRVLVTVPGDGGSDIAFVADLARPGTTDISLNFRWSLITWTGADGVTPAAALAGATAADDITAKVSVIYGWDAAAQAWQAYFPSGEGIPGANNLAKLDTGKAYWVAIDGPGNVTWPVPDAK
ncbi:MAG: hypothetical protein WBO97_02085 [Tepidiformaceae bacterium]